MSEQHVAAGMPVPQSSVVTRFRHPQEVTVRFKRWTQVGQTAYQKGQCAGFLRPAAEAMVRKGVCEILVMAEPKAAAGKAKAA